MKQRRREGEVGVGVEVSPKCDNLQSPLTSILPGPGLMSLQPMERYPVLHTHTLTPPLHCCSHHCCCSLDLIPLTSADLSTGVKAGWTVGRMEAYYPSSSALNYLNANDREGGGQ